jgi:hypothetical protein
MKDAKRSRPRTEKSTWKKTEVLQFACSRQYEHSRYLALHDGDTGVRGAQIDPNNFISICSIDRAATVKYQQTTPIRHSRACGMLER